MKNSAIFWGTFLISIGTFFLLNTLGVQLGFLEGGWRLWPLFIIFWGVSLLKIHPVVKSILTVAKSLTLTVIISSLLFCNVCFDDSNSSFSCQREYHNYRPENSQQNSYKVALTNNLKEASFNIDGGAAVFNVGNITNELINVYSHSTTNHPDFDFTIDSSEGNYTLSMSGLRFDNMFGNNKMNRVAWIELNNTVDWKLNFDIGAAELNADLRNYNVSSVDINAGAASINLKIGELAKLTKLNIDCGASSVKISIPKNSGCEIDSDTGLSNLTVDGMKQKNGKYYTDNFSSSENKILIAISAGVSSFKIVRE